MIVGSFEIVCHDECLITMFRSFFLRASTVEDAELHFSIDEYTDVVTLTKPIIYISVKEMISTHSVWHDVSTVTCYFD